MSKQSVERAVGNVIHAVTFDFWDTLYYDTDTSDTRRLLIAEALAEAQYTISVLIARLRPRPQPGRDLRRPGLILQPHLAHSGLFLRGRSPRYWGQAPGPNTISCTAQISAVVVLRRTQQWKA